MKNLEQSRGFRDDVFHLFPLSFIHSISLLGLDEVVKRKGGWAKNDVSEGERGERGQRLELLPMAGLVFRSVDFGELTKIPVLSLHS